MGDAEIQDLLAFAAVARARSFRGAAAQHGGSASRLSAAVRRAEARLGVRLLNRTTRSVAPTEAGQRLLERLAPALDEVAAAVDGLNAFRDRPAGTLRLNVPGVVARLVLPDLIPRFLAAYPEVQIEVVAQDAFVDVVEAGFDAGIRYGERLEQDMIAVPIGPRVQRYACVAAPAYLDRHGRPSHPRDLMERPAVRHRFLHGVSLPWEFLKDGDAVSVAPAARVLTNSLDLQRAALVAGLGIGAGFFHFYADLIAAGALEEVLPDWAESFPGPFLFYSQRRYLPAPLRAFVDFVRQDQQGARP